MFPADLASAADALSKHGLGPCNGFCVDFAFTWDFPGIADGTTAAAGATTAGLPDTGTATAAPGATPAGLPLGLPNSTTFTVVPSF